MMTIFPQKHIIKQIKNVSLLSLILQADKNIH